MWRARILLPGRTETGEACSAHEAVQRAATALRVRELLRAGEPTRAELAAREASMRRHAVAACDTARVAEGSDGLSQPEVWAMHLAADRIAVAIGRIPLHNAATTAPAQEQTPIVGAGNVP